MSNLTRRNCVALALAATACAPMGLEPGVGKKVAAGARADSLHALAKAKGLRFGSCAGTAAPQKRSSSFDDPRVRDIMIDECGMLVPENELKWYTLRTRPDVFDFRRADRLIDFAGEHDMSVRGHTLLWHHPKWFPDWIKTYDFGPRPALAAEQLLREHIATVCSRYGTRIFAWDVVNETIDPATGEMRETVFTQHLGPRVIDIAFEAAREAAPHAQLVYNDYMSWAPGNEKHCLGVLKLLERLRAGGVPIDALGVQSHIGTDNNGDATGFAAMQETAWRKFLDEAVGMGFDLAITEFDVHDKGLPADIAVRDRTVADFGRTYLDLMLSYKEVKYVMAWGLVDRYSWLQDRTPRADQLPKRPDPFDDAYQPKLLRNAIADAFRAAPVRA